MMKRLSLLDKITGNPAFGLLPMWLFSLLLLFTGVTAAMGVALLLSLVGVWLVEKPMQLIYRVSLITFLTASFLFLLPIGVERMIEQFLIVEVLFLLSLIVMRLTRKRIVIKRARQRSELSSNYLKETLRVAFQAYYGLTLHLLLVVALLMMGIGGTTTEEKNGWVYFSAQLVLLVLILLETGRLYLLFKKLNREEWLPVVTEQGDVTGKVAKSVTREMKNRYMHPVVRVALIYKGMIYLRERDSSRLLNPGLLDYPFEKYMQYEHDIDESVLNSIRNACANQQIPLQFLLKYVFENEDTKRLVFLYASDIEDEALFNSLRLEGGKLWTEAQIEDNLGTMLFSECFEMEYEYLKNTILLAHQFRTKMSEKR